MNTLIPHTRTNVQNLVQFIGIVREKYQNKLTVDMESLLLMATNKDDAVRLKFAIGKGLADIKNNIEDF